MLYYFHGALAEQLRRGLQNLVDQCNSGTHLHLMSLGRVAELVYAADLKSASFTGLWVRVPSRPPTQKRRPKAFIFCVASGREMGREPRFGHSRSREKTEKYLYFDFSEATPCDVYSKNRLSHLAHQRKKEGHWAYFLYIAIIMLKSKQKQYYFSRRKT